MLRNNMTWVFIVDRKLKNNRGCGCLLLNPYYYYMYYIFIIGLCGYGKFIIIIDKKFYLLTRDMLWRRKLIYYLIHNYNKLI